MMVLVTRKVEVSEIGWKWSAGGRIDALDVVSSSLFKQRHLR
jgi:hypothetical protein